MRILVLEDDLETAAALRVGLSREGHDVVVASDLESGRSAIAAGSFDVAILDVSLPDGSGYEALASLRAGRPETFILMLTARGSVEDRIEGLDRGADDYLVKPFAYAELAARIRALTRRSPGQPVVLTAGELQIDRKRHVATIGESRLDLTPIEFGLLAMLMEAGGETVPRGALLREVWGYDFDPSTNVVDVHVNRLRRKLEAAGVSDLIQTHRGQGYAVV